MEGFSDEDIMTGGAANAIDSDDEVEPGSAGGAAGAEDGDEPAGSALQENIRRKGANSYYYAHKTKIGKWVTRFIKPFTLSPYDRQATVVLALFENACRTVSYSVRVSSNSMRA
jgi:hypothetical protein